VATRPSTRRGRYCIRSACSTTYGTHLRAPASRGARSSGTVTPANTNMSSACRPSAGPSCRSSDGVDTAPSNTSWISGSETPVRRVSAPMSGYITRFLGEDTADHPGTRSALQRECRQRAYGVIQRSRAWGDLIAEHHPHGVRLSTHPQPIGAPPARASASSTPVTPGPRRGTRPRRAAPMAHGPSCSSGTDVVSDRFSPKLVQASDAPPPALIGSPATAVSMPV